MDFALSPEQLAWQDRARETARRVVAPRARASDESGTFDRGVIDALSHGGVLALPLPREYGGGALDHL